MSPSFAVIAEGPSDFEVLRHVLAGFFSDPDIIVVQLQPAVDATSGRSSPGGWYEVFRFIGSDKFVGAFERADFVVVQIDTDVCEEPHFGVSRRGPDGREREVEEMVAATRERLIKEIGAANYARFAARLVFAVAVDSIECWLLPLYYTDKRRGKTTNCLGSLNEALGAREGFSIDVEKKQVKYYLKILRPLAKRKMVDSCAPHNASFQAFVVTLASLQGR
jgi:hypothetical protein